MQGLTSYRSSIYLAAAILILSTGFCMTQGEDSLPERCRKAKPKTSLCDTKIRKWFLHETKGCKKSGFCSQDTEIYDTQNDINYFLSEEACMETCMIHVNCPTLEPIPNGTVSNNGVGYWGKSVTYTCNKGYSLVGSPVRTCQYNAIWTSEAPVCQAKCLAPRLSHDNLFTIAPLQDFYKPGDTIVYSCKEGYVNVAAGNRRTCLEDLTWSGNEATCEPEVLCPEPELIEHGTPHAPSLNVGSSLTYQCDTGFMLHGNTTRRCNMSREWTGKKPICFKFSIKKCMEGERSVCDDVTNQTVTLREGDMNVVFIAQLSEPNPFQNTNGMWEAELADLVGVIINGNELKISKVLSNGQHTRQFRATMSSYLAYFDVSVIESIEPNLMKPQVIVSPRSQEISIGDRVHLGCIFKGNPSPNVTWFHNGNPLLPNSEKQVSEEFAVPFVVGSLNILQVTPQDLGNYTCLGINGEGKKQTDVGTVTIRVSDSTRSVSRRSVESSLCRSSAPPDTVTIVGRVRKETRRFRAPGTTVYQMEVKQVLSSSTEPLTRKNLRTIVLDGSINTPNKLNRSGLYILQGKVHSNTLFIHGHDSILSHSSELEHSLQNC